MLLAAKTLVALDFAVLVNLVILTLDPVNLQLILPGLQPVHITKLVITALVDCFDDEFLFQALKVRRYCKQRKFVLNSSNRGFACRYRELRARVKVLTNVQIFRGNSIHGLRDFELTRE